jgi:sugar lactone lactonase YvrE
MKKRSITRLMLAVLVGLTLVVPTAGLAEAKPRSLPDRIELPDGWQPEGITIGPGPIAYLGSRTDGDILAANLKTGGVRVFSQGPGPGFPAIGLKSDQRGLLYVAGGGAGTGRVVSTRTGKTLRTYQFATGTPTAPTFVNDVVLSKRFAWFTDSQRPQLYVVPRARRGKPAPANSFRTLPLRGEWQQVSGATNANGIALTPNGRALLVVNTSTGDLFRVNPWTGVARRVNLGGYQLTNGDGLLLKGRILYVVQNRLNQVAVIKLSESGRRGRLVDTLTAPACSTPPTNACFDVPTTVAAYKGSLFLPNARFGVANPEAADYWVTRIDAYRS